MASKIHFIRHGITEGNIKMWFYGSEDLPLAEEGINDLLELKARDIYPRLPEDSDCYTTGLLRTEETFAIIFGSREHKVIDDFREMRFGRYEKMPYEVLKDIPEFMAWAFDETGDVSLPGGETKNQFTSRVSKGLTELRGCHRLKELSGCGKGTDTVSAVVCHGGVIASIMEEMFPGKRGNILEWIPKPGFGYTVSFEEGQPVSYEKIGDE